MDTLKGVKMEKYTIKKVGTSKFGNYLLIDDGTPKGQFKGITEQVNKYLSDKAPCIIEIQETTGEGRDEKVSKVKVLSQVSTPNNQTSVKQDAFRINIDAGNAVDRAIKLLELGKAEDMDSAVTIAVSAFQKALQLIEKPLPLTKTGEQSSDFIQTYINKSGELE